MIVDLDRKKLAETFENTIDPNLLYEEGEALSGVDDDDDTTTAHDHHHHHISETEPVLPVDVGQI